MLSVDNYVPAVYNRFYNQKEQGNVADYVIIMGYDEHYAGGEAGSVSSIGYVENGIKDMLSLVPKEKVIKQSRSTQGSGREAATMRPPCDGNLRGDKMGVGERHGSDLG